MWNGMNFALRLNIDEPEGLNGDYAEETATFMSQIEQLAAEAKSYEQNFDNSKDECDKLYAVMDEVNAKVARDMGEIQELLKNNVYTFVPPTLLR